MARLRWGADLPSGAGEARERLLDAAESCLFSLGFTKITVEAVATEANVSRATIYRYFDGRDDLLFGVLLRHGSRSMAAIEHLFTDLDDPVDLLVEVMAETIERVREDPHLAALFGPGSAGLTMALPGAHAKIKSIAQRTLERILSAADAQNRLRPGTDMEEAAEFALRVVVSLLEIDDPEYARSGPELRRFLRRYLAPALFSDAPAEPKRAIRGARVRAARS